MQQHDCNNCQKSPFMYFLMVLLAVGVSYIGWNFGGVSGAIIGFLLSCVGNIYALTIKPHE